MNDPSRAKRSTFVTAVAWVFIALAGFAASVCLLQILMLSIIYPHGAMPPGDQADSHVRDFARLILSHIRLIFLLLFLVFATTLAAAVGLLKRASSARIVFIAMMGFGVVWNVASIVLLLYFLPSRSEVLTAHSLTFAAQFNVVRNVTFLFEVAADMAFVGLFGWIIRRLTSDEICREFRDPMN